MAAALDYRQSLLTGWQSSLDKANLILSTRDFPKQKMARTLGKTIQTGKWKFKRTILNQNKTIATFKHIDSIDPLTGTLIFKGRSIKMKRSKSQVNDNENRLIAKGKIGPKGMKFKDELFNSKSGYYELREIDFTSPSQDNLYRIILWGDNESHAWMKTILEPSVFGIDPLFQPYRI